MSTEHHNVIILGAGASFEAGIPLMDSFVDTTWSYAVRGKAGETEISDDDRKLFADAQQIRQRLERYNSRAYFNARNLEDILSLLSFEALNGEKHAGDFDLFVKAVARTIEISCKYLHSSNRPQSLIRENYHRLWLELLSKEFRPLRPALITFNYDLVLERTLWESFHSQPHTPAVPPEAQSCAVKYFYSIYDYVVRRSSITTRHAVHGLREVREDRVEYHYGDDPPEVEIPYLKLHGSLNWNQNSPAQDPKNRITPDHFPTQAVSQPFILPPVFNKMNSREINAVWRVALEVLRQAKHIIIVGYSLPKTDIYMQYFLKSAVGPNSSLQKIIVFDPVLYENSQRTEEMKKRYLECFSPQFSSQITFNPPHNFTSDSDKRLGTFLHFVRMLKNRQLFFYP